MNGNGGHRRRLLLGAVALVLVTSLVTYAATAYVYEQQLERLGLMEELAQTQSFGRFLDVIRLVRTEYVDAVDLEILVEGATSGVVESLGDEYSVYFDAKEFQDFNIVVSGEYEGIGVVVTERGEYVTVQTPFPNSPGASTPPEEAGEDTRPGLRPGDRIVEVDGRSIVGVPVDKAVQLIRGPEGTEVRLTVLRTNEEGSDRRLHFAIERAHIEIPTVQSAKMLSPRVGYLWVSMFTRFTPGDVEQALDRLRAEGMEALVLDLRNNPGGDLGASVRVASEFVPRGPVVYVVERDGKRHTYRSDSPALGLPLVVLVNDGSASASEIVAGAIQDYEAGVIAGQKTFGKGSVQTVFTLDGNGEAAGADREDREGEAGVKLTTAKYLTPDERSVHGQGLEPDVLLEEGPKEQGNLERDAQLRSALEMARERLDR